MYAALLTSLKPNAGIFLRPLIWRLGVGVKTRFDLRCSSIILISLIMEGSSDGLESLLSLSSFRNCTLISRRMGATLVYFRMVPFWILDPSPRRTFLLVLITCSILRSRGLLESGFPKPEIEGKGRKTERKAAPSQDDQEAHQEPRFPPNTPEPMKIVSLQFLRTIMEPWSTAPAVGSIAGETNSRNQSLELRPSYTIAWTPTSVKSFCAGAATPSSRPPRDPGVPSRPVTTLSMERSPLRSRT